jgi:Zn-dependent protease with chaperone function
LAGVHMNIFSAVKEKITQYITAYLKLLKINFIDRTSNVLGYIIFTLIGLFLAFCILLFLGLGLVEVFSTIGCSRLASFFIVIAIYLLLLIIMVMLRKNIVRFFVGSIIKVLTEGDNDDESEQTN